MNELFLDSSFVIALAAPADEFHERASQLSLAFEDASASIVTTSAVLLEIGNALARLRFRHIAVQLLDGIYEDSRIEVAQFNAGLMDEALDLYKQHDDKEWGLTDCLSFVVMNQRGITDALTSDHHFRQAGFRALLLEDI